MKTLIFILLSVYGISGFAQSDPDAMKILDEVSKQALSGEALRIDFKYIIEDKKENTKHEQKGELTMKGPFYILDLLGNTLYFDGKKNYNYIKEANEVNILLPDENEETVFFTDPSKLFTFYKEGYKSRLNSINGQVADIDLFPEDIKENYFRINFQIDNSKKEIKSFKVFAKDGTSYEVVLTSVKAVQVEDKEFTFNARKHPGVEVIDMTE